MKSENQQPLHTSTSKTKKNPKQSNMRPEAYKNMNEFILCCSSTVEHGFTLV